MAASETRDGRSARPPRYYVRARRYVPYVIRRWLTVTQSTSVGRRRRRDVPRKIAERFVTEIRSAGWHRRQHRASSVSGTAE